jgi:hypothetical protein
MGLLLFEILLVKLSVLQGKPCPARLLVLNELKNVFSAAIQGGSL